METITMNYSKHQLPYWEKSGKLKQRASLVTKSKILWLVGLLVVSLFANAQVDIETGLQHFYAFEGNLNDSTTNNFNGTVTAGALELAQGFDGASNSAYYFDGTDKVSFGNIPLGSGSFTLALWMKVPALVSNYSHSLFSKRSVCGEGQFFDIRITNSSTLGYTFGIEMRDDGQTGHVNTNFGTFDQWVHVAFVKNSDTHTSSLFINGDSITSTAWTSTILDMTNTANFSIGSTPCLSNPNTGPFKGTLDEVRFYNRACKETEIFKMTGTEKPVFEISAQQLFLERNFATQTINTIDQIQSMVTYSLTSMPENPLFINHSFNPSNGTLILDPVTDSSGYVVYTITASANGETYSKEVDVTVRRPFEDGLIAYYPFDGNANEGFGSTAFNGTVTSAIQGKDRQNKPSMAYYFDGNGDYITVADNDALDFDDNLDFAVSLWFRTPKSSTNQILFEKGATPKYNAYVTSTGKIAFSLVYGSGSNLEELVTPLAYDDNYWHQVSFSADRNGNAHIYIDGQLVATKSLTLVGTLSTTNSLRFGSQSAANALYYTGYLDDIRIYNRTLTQADATGLALERKPYYLELVNTNIPNHGFLMTNDSISLTFNKQVDAGSGALIKVYGSLSGRLDGTTSILGNYLTFKPSALLKNGEQISFVAPHDVMATDGDTLKFPLHLNFTVKATSSFENPVVFNTEETLDATVSGLTAVNTGDLDSDGDIDAVVISRGEGKITVYKNDGAAVFTQTNITTSNTTAYHMCLADMDGDTDLDIVITNDTKIAWYANAGDGTFGALTDIITLPATKYSIEVGDLDADGDLDIVAHGKVYSNLVYAIYNNGAATSFSSLITAYTPLGANTYEVVKGFCLANVDNDAALEIVLATQAAGGYIRVLQPNSTFTAYTNSLVYTYSYDFGLYVNGAGMSVTAADFNNDGKVDLVMGSSGANGSSFSKIHYMTGNGDGTFNTAINVLTLESGWKNYGGLNLVPADMDGDMDLDVVYYGTDSKLGWIDNNQGTFTVKKVLNTTANPYLDGSYPLVALPQLADLNGDGRMEIVVPTTAKIIYHQQRDDLTLLSSNPGSQAINVNLSSNITMAFDADLNPASVASTSVKVTGSKSGSISGTVTVQGGDSIVFDPAQNFLGGETISVTIDNTIVSITNGAFAGSSFTFTTDQVILLSSYPTPNQFMVPRDTVIRLTFDRSINPSTVDSLSIRVYSHFRGYIKGTRQVTGSEVIFTPAEPFWAGENVKIELTSNLEGLDENASNLNYFEFFVASDLVLNGTASFVLHSLGSPSSQYAYSAIPGDIDDDGDMDIVYNDQPFGIWYRLENLNGGKVFGPTTEMSNGNGYGVFTGLFEDIDKNGTLDLMMAGNSIVGWIKNLDNTNTFNYNQNLFLNSSNQLRDIDVSDIDKDGNKDVMVSWDNISQLNVYEQNTTLDAFSSTTVAFTGITQSFGSKFFDMNNDGYEDIIVTDFGADGKVRLLTNNKNGGFTSKDLGNVVNASYLDIFDLDLDGDAEIIVGSATGTINIFENKGNGDFTELVITALSQCYFVKAGDINADGLPDVVFSSWDTQTIAYLKNLGNLDFEVVVLQTNIMSYFLNLADIDKDGDLDIITSSRSPNYSNRAYILENFIIDVNDAPAVANPISDYQMYEDNGVFQVNPDVVTVFTDPDGDILSYSVVSSDPTNVSVEINNNSIFVTVAPNYFGIANITLTASDGIATASDVFQVEVFSVNDAPIFTLSQNSLTLEQDFTGTETITVIPGTVPANESNQVVNYTITPANYANVSINASTGEVSIVAIAGVYGTQEITVVASDGQTENYLYYLSFILTINRVNTAPTDIQLSNQQIPENNEGTAWIGSFNSIDATDFSGFSYALVAGDGDTDNALFFIGGGVAKSNGDMLYSNTAFNFENKAEYSIRVRTTDPLGAIFEKSFAISVTNQNDAPTSISINEYSLIENSPLGTIVGSFAVSDEDAGETFNVWLYNGEAEVANDNSSFVIDGMHLKVNSLIDFELKPTYTIMVYAADVQGLTTNVTTFNLSVTDVIETSISVNDENKELHLYPNPSNGKFTLQTGDSNDETIIRIIHTSGKEVYVGKFGKDELEIGVDISNQPAGAYIVSIIKGNRVIHKSMVLE